MPPIVSSSGSHFGSTLPHILGASGKTTNFLLIFIFQTIKRFHLRHLHRFLWAKLVKPLLKVHAVYLAVSGRNTVNSKKEKKENCNLASISAFWHLFVVHVHLPYYFSENQPSSLHSQQFPFELF
jgi:hypothetical protein